MPFLQHRRFLLPDHDTVLFLASVAHKSQIDSLDRAALKIDGIWAVAVKHLHSRGGVGHLDFLPPVRPHLAGQKHLLFSGGGGLGDDGTGEAVQQAASGAEIANFLNGGQCVAQSNALIENELDVSDPCFRLQMRAGIILAVRYQYAHQLNRSIAIVDVVNLLVGILVFLEFVR